MDVSQYLEIFIDETKEHLQSLNDQLLILETEPENVETINEIFRAAHSLKGMAGTMGFKRMQRLTHDMENVFSEIRNGNMKVTADLVDVLFKGLDALEAYLSNIQESADEGTEDYEDIISQLNKILNIGLGKETKEQGKEEVSGADAVTGITVQSDSSAEKFRNLNIQSYERKAIQKAYDIGMNVFGITVYIQETCILKAARAFLVFKSLEGLGEVIKSQPDIQDIEDEKFDFDFSMVLLTKESLENIEMTIANISEIQNVYIDHLTLEQSADDTMEAEEENSHKQEKSNGKNTVNTKNNAIAAKQSSKPVVNRSVRVDIEKLDVLMNLVSELIIAKNGLVSISSSEGTSRGESGFNEQIEYLERVTTNLHESVMKVRMVPIESVTNRFPRMIRDLSKKLDKKMELYMSGEETELDRTVIDEIGDPLMHLLRNAADHGLESNQERIAAGKPEVGSIFLEAYQDGNNVVIEVRDDGGGINVEKVKKKAVEKGTLTQEQADVMSEKDAIDLLFRPSFSTADTISEVSGRGVGLDVVKTKIESLGGDIEANTKLGAGSNFIIRLPLTLAIIQALMVELGSEKYAIPLGSIQTIEDVKISEIKYVHSKEVINLRGNVIPIIRLDKVLDVESDHEVTDHLTVVIVSKGDRLAGLVIDNLIGQQEIVIKSIGKYITNNKIIGGATILGDGEVALILDVNTLV
ncbi:chemotaxis protein CheA [Anaerocolumna aminovalerica]|jgi:two-component system chemotaxis sensor kinase CheA|uniref:Chemotaxis protein CheA n=1 Tax=Anaerocolumna aminovalerica TaxID=1527 RepID=A0A1I5I4C5_9FIRM|nr:chemotaxis protein CheA [Anaerocolumna aminovalerica]SFO55444.1 two-component system, chemotaxis family, sensor kinase CheA [Anaerocolumna aminovalerica]